MEGIAVLIDLIRGNVSVPEVVCCTYMRCTPLGIHLAKYRSHLSRSGCTLYGAQEAIASYPFAGLYGDVYFTFPGRDTSCAHGKNSSASPTARSGTSGTQAACKFGKVSSACFASKQDVLPHGSCQRLSSVSLQLSLFSKGGTQYPRP